MTSRCQKQNGQSRSNPDGGSSATTQTRSVTIRTATAGAYIRYTTDGSIPTASNGTSIASGATVQFMATSDGTSLQAIGCESGWNDSQVHEATYYYVGGNGPSPGGGGAESSSQQSVSPGYDANGNVVAYKGWTYSYDAQNRLTSASNGAHTALFHYDGKNRQIMRSIDTAVRFSGNYILDA